MKLRNKLVAVLAASMVVTSVPVVTMADTTNYVSTGRYAQKGTTYGYLAGSVNGYDVVYGQAGPGIGGSVPENGYDYKYSNGFEFVPQFDYSQTGSMFMSLTKDTKFNENAILAYVDAFNSADGHSNISFKKDSDNKDVVWLANNKEWNGQRVEDLMKSGTVKMYFNNATGDNNGSATPAFEGKTGVVSAADIRAQIDTVFTAKKNAAITAGTLYTADKTADLDVAAIVDAIMEQYNTLLTTEKDKDGNIIKQTVKLRNVTISQNKISKILEKVVASAKASNEATTSYAQLYKAGPNGTQLINTDKLQSIIDETVKDVNKWIYDETFKMPDYDEVITITKVESFDVKDANDREYQSHLRVDFSGNFERGASYRVPLLAKLDGDKTVILNIDGRDSFVTSGKYNLTQDTLTDKRLTATADGGAKLRTNYADPIGELRFTESQIKSLTNGGKNRKIQISLPASSDLEFNLEKTVAGAQAVGKRGFFGQTTVASPDNNPNIEFLAESGYVNNSTAYINALAAELATTTPLNAADNKNDRLRISYGITSRRNSYTDIDKQTLIVELPDFADDLAVGEIALSGIYVQPKDGTAQPGEIKVTVEEYLAPGWSNTINTNQNFVEAPFDNNGNYYHNNVQYYVLTKTNGYQPYTYATNVTVNRNNNNNGKLYVLTNGSTTVSSAAQASTNLIASTELKVGEIKEYAITLKCDKPTDIKAGRSGILNKKTTEFILEENVKDSLVDNRKIEFKMENGYMFGPADIDYTDVAANANGAIAKGLYGSTNYKQKAIQKFKDLVADKVIEFKEKAAAGDGKKGFVMSTLDLIIDAEGRVIGFSGEYDRLKSSEADKIKIKVPVATDVMNKGEVKVIANTVYTRSFQDKDEDISCPVANIKTPIEVTFDGAKLKVGQQAQEAGTITIKETEQGMLEKGWLFLAAKDQEGITFDTIPTVKVADASGKQLAVKNVELSKDKTMLGIEISKTSTEASTITVEGINLTADRTVPQANYDLAIWGTALTDENELGITNFTQNALYSHAYFNQTSDLYIVEKFIQMTTANTEDLSGSAKAVTTEFVIGKKEYTVNGEKQVMDSAAYIKDGLTFVPVKYLAKAFGVADSAIQYDKKTATATIVSGDKVINITKGKAYLTVNGTQVPMATKAEVNKENRMCVPMAYIASALGVDKSWDSATKTATFTNVRK